MTRIADEYALLSPEAQVPIWVGSSVRICHGAPCLQMSQVSLTPVHNLYSMEGTDLKVTRFNM